MKRFEVWELVQAVRVSSGNGHLLSSIKPDNPNKGVAIELVKRHVKQLIECCRAADLRVSAMEAESLLVLCKPLPDHFHASVGQSIEKHTTSLICTIEREMSLRTYFSFDESETRAWSATEVFGEAVSDAFPSTDFELVEESKCYALGRYTAAAFHLMRVLEIGISALAVSIGCDPSNKSWESILGNIQSELNKLSQAKPQGWKETEQFYSEFSAHFRNLKNAWRNYTMHVHVSYDKERVEEMFVHVRGLMKVLSARIKE